MFVTIARVSDVERFLETFSTIGADKRREHGSRGAAVFRDPVDPDRLIVVHDWPREGYERFLADPSIPAVARELALVEPPLELRPVAQYDA